MNVKAIGIIATATLALLSGCGVQSSADSELKTIKVGVIAPMSGPAAVYGEQIRRVTDVELPKVNEEIASQGYQLELVFEDGKCTGPDSIAALQKLADVDGVKFIFGGVCSSESIGFAPLLATKKVLALSGFSSNPDLNDMSPYFFSLSYRDDIVSKGIADILGKYKKVAIITEQNDYNQALQRNVRAELKANYPNTTVVADESFAKGNTELRNILQKVKSTEPDVLFINPNAGVTGKAFVRQLAEIKDWQVEKVSQVSLMAESVVSEAPEALEGTTIVDGPKVNDKALLDLISTIEKEKGTLGDIGNYYTASLIDGLHILGKIITETDANPVEARDLLAKDTFSGFLGSIKFDNHTFVQGIGTAQFVIRSGKIVTLK